MNTSTIGNKKTLSYEYANEILTPTDVDLEDGLLRWRLEYKLGRLQQSCLRAVPVDGCLEDLLHIVAGLDAGINVDIGFMQERVLQFVMRRGVLAVRPQVDYTSSRDLSPGIDIIPGSRADIPRPILERNSFKIEDTFRESFTFTFTEQMGFYLTLANEARNMIRVMDYVRTGKTPYLSDLVGWFWGSKIEDLGGLIPEENELLTPREAYGLVLRMAEKWYKAATFHLSLVATSEASDPNQQAFAPVQRFASDIVLNWGDCDASRLWDAMDWWFRPAWWAPPLGSDWQSDEFFHKPFRPSPLFNVLMFQLMKRIALPEGSHWCIQCGRVYTLNEKYEMMKAAVKKEDEWRVSYPRNPRKDTGSACSPGCETRRKQEQWCNSKRRSANGEPKLTRAKETAPTR